MNDRQLFQKHLAPTSLEPMALPISKAKGSSLFDDEGNEYIDLIGGISVCNVGHCHPKVVAAIKEQAEKYLHVMVYGEVIQSPQVQYAALLTRHLPETLNSVYFTNSGAEAVEGAMKLAKRVTGRTEILACHNSYHGSTQGALSIIGDEYWRNAYRPLLPDIRHVWHNDFESLRYITTKTACIILEPVQAEGGVLVPDTAWMKALRERCDETGTLLILDEIQVGFGRTGSLWGFTQFDIIPDVLLLGKALGGGLPLGAFIASQEKMVSLADKPVLGHITTFGGHPLSCVAGKAAMEALLEEKMPDEVFKKEQLFLSLLKHPAIKAVRSKGLMMAIELADFEVVKNVITNCLKGYELENGMSRVFTDWFLFAPNCIRLVPPLNITEAEIRKACAVLISAIEKTSDIHQ
ncbi:aspartate aminotransferase family protein [Taibaiella lutea]|uniref:Aspartate aminotransferase family protein n=1 Tax=Taibaiella lutea TaxID=2608001 RepID=A0A5M6CPY3_9BACT|nr:aminotransferase class III-fold pyridoxal phosphate-dependent enzyme [Taibaiella lutea]KAA5537157.1 aspartate aminotransferase family protein [Taibaiella lutea]